MSASPAVSVGWGPDVDEWVVRPRLRSVPAETARSAPGLAWTVAGGLVLLVLLLPVIGLVFGLRTMIVTGGSMSGVTEAGDALILRVTDGADIGDVVTFSPLRSDGLVTHRVIEVIELDGVVHYQTQGDANASPDPDLVPASNVHGVVEHRLAGLGAPLAWATGRAGLTLLVVVPAGLLILGELRAMFPRRRRQRAVRLKVVSSVALVVALLSAPALGAFTDTASVGSNVLSSGTVTPPTLDSATADALICRIALTWTAPSTGLSPDGYDVYRSTTSGGPYGFVKHVGTVTSTTDTGLAGNTTYHYVLRTTRAGWTSVDSNQRSAKTALLCA